MAVNPETIVSTRTNELNVEGEAAIYRSFRHFWHPVMYSHELGDTAPRRTMLCGEQLVVVRLKGEVAAFADICAHRGTMLSLGTVENDELRCAYHGWQYNAQGHCTFIPQKPELAGALNARLTRYHVEERYGMIWVCLEDEPRFPIPEFPQYDDAELDFEHVLIPSTDWDCAAPRRTENYTDLSHFGTLHDGILGSRDQPGVPPHSARRENNALVMQLDEDQDRADLKRLWKIYMPLTVLLHVANWRHDVHYILFFHPTPIGPRVTRNFTVASRNFDKEQWVAEEALGFVDVVYEQDRPVVESQRPEELPEDLSRELHVKNVDTYSLNYRKWLVELAHELDGRASKNGNGSQPKR